VVITEFLCKATVTGFNDFEDDEVNVKLGAINNLDIELQEN
jgi:hypothetical protein